MELQQQIKLNDDKANSSAQPSSCNQEENLSKIHQRASSISGQEGPNSRPERSPQKKVRKVSSCFSIVYKVMLMIFILGSAGRIIFLILGGFDGHGFEKLKAFCDGWQLLQCILAFSGFRRRNLEKISKALRMMLIYYLLIWILFLNGGFEGKVRHSGNKKEGSDSEYDEDGGPEQIAILLSVFHTILLILPTWKVRNFLKTVPEDYEETCKEQTQTNGPIERLGSEWFTIYKSGLLLLFCVQVPNLVSEGLEDFDASPRLFEKIMSDPSLTVSTVLKYLAVPLRGIFTFLVFQGIRRKNLEKILVAIKIMGVSIVVELALHAMKELALGCEGKCMVEDKTVCKDFKVDSGWFLPLPFGVKISLLGAYYFLHLYGTLKARDILKSHQEVKRIL